MDAFHIELIVGDTFDVPLHPPNLSQWVSEDGSCKLHMGVAH